MRNWIKLFEGTGVPIETLPAVVKADILDMMLGPNGPVAFRDYWMSEHGSASFNDTYVAQMLFGSENLAKADLFDEPMLSVPAVEIDLADMNVDDRATSPAVVQKYSELSPNAPPILVRLHEGKWIVVEGGHRTKAAILRGDAKIKAFDVTSIYDLTEEDWRDLESA